MYVDLLGALVGAKPKNKGGTKGQSPEVDESSTFGQFMRFGDPESYEKMSVEERQKKTEDMLRSHAIFRGKYAEGLGNEKPREGSPR